MFIATATLAALFVGFFWWMIALQKKEDGIIGTIEHPFFGRVKQKRESWETSMTVPDLGSDLALSSYEGNEPTENQQNTVNWLSDLAETITEQLDDGLSRSMLEHGPQRALAIPTPPLPKDCREHPADREGLIRSKWHYSRENSPRDRFDTKNPKERSCSLTVVMFF